MSTLYLLKKCIKNVQKIGINRSGDFLTNSDDKMLDLKYPHTS